MLWFESYMSGCHTVLIPQYQNWKSSYNSDFIIMTLLFLYTSLFCHTWSLLSHWILSTCQYLRQTSNSLEFLSFRSGNKSITLLFSLSFLPATIKMLCKEPRSFAWQKTICRFKWKFSKCVPTRLNNRITLLPVIKNPEKHFWKHFCSCAYFENPFKINFAPFLDNFNEIWRVLLLDNILVIEATNFSHCSKFVDAPDNLNLFY